MKRDRCAQLLCFRVESAGVSPMTSPLDQLLRDVRDSRELPPPVEARAIREEARVSTGRLSQALGVHRSTLSRWERGLATPRHSARALYAAALASLQSELPG